MTRSARPRAGAWRGAVVCAVAALLGAASTGCGKAKATTDGATGSTATVASSTGTEAPNAGLMNATGASGSPEVATAPGKTGFRFVVQEPKKAELKMYRPLFDHKRLATVIAALNGIQLPRDVPVVAGECGQVNAMYMPKKHMVSVCYELADEFYKKFSSLGHDDQTASDETLNALTFTVLHEIGHAIIGELELGVTGGEEDAVDDFATAFLIDDVPTVGAEWASDGAVAMYLLDSDKGSKKPAYFDEHSMGEQRFFNILCMVLGSNVEKFKGLVPKPLPERRAVRCEDEYKKKDKAWNVMLEPHKKKK
ncbi:MAG: hypothetical protein IT373_34210 [Polyangiaceae bacterium]|nr:hypothetical protein [Polyangiaceae bacterium]